MYGLGAHRKGTAMYTPTSIQLYRNAVSAVAIMVLLLLYHHGAASIATAMALGTACV